VRPDLQSDQVSHLLTRSARDMNAGTGCRQCPLLRDRLTGWGRLDVAAALAQALAGDLPPADALEPNDDAGGAAATLWGAGGRTIRGTIDFWDDRTDVYRVMLRPGQRLHALLTGAPAGTRIFLWQPGTRRVEGIPAAMERRLRVAQSTRTGAAEQLVYRAPRPGIGDGWYYLQVRIDSPGFSQYTLSFTKR
jgi:hypothetical protein